MMIETDYAEIEVGTTPVKAAPAPVAKVAHRLPRWHRILRAAGKPEGAVMMICTRCGASFEAAGRAKYCPACRVAAKRESAKKTKPFNNALLIFARQTESLQAAADERRRSMFARLRARDAAAPKCRVTVELRNGVRVETRGTVGGGMCLGVNRSMLPHLKVDRHLWGLMH